VNEQKRTQDPPQVVPNRGQSSRIGFDPEGPGADAEPGVPGSGAGDRYMAGTPAGGTEVGGLAGTNIGDGAPGNADIEEAMFDTDDEVAGDEPNTPPYSGKAGGAVGGTPAEGRVTGGMTHGGLDSRSPGRGDSTIGSDPHQKQP
jgi:hypothetical protein